MVNTSGTGSNDLSNKNVTQPKTAETAKPAMKAKPPQAQALRNENAPAKKELAKQITKGSDLMPQNLADASKSIAAQQVKVVSASSPEARQALGNLDPSTFNGNTLERLKTAAASFSGEATFDAEPSQEDDLKEAGLSRSFVTIFQKAGQLKD